MGEYGKFALDFARDVLALFPTGHLARVLQAFWLLGGQIVTACVLVVFPLRDPLNLTVEEP